MNRKTNWSVLATQVGPFQPARALQCMQSTVHPYAKQKLCTLYKNSGPTTKASCTPYSIRTPLSSGDYHYHHLPTPAEPLLAAAAAQHQFASAANCLQCLHPAARAAALQLSQQKWAPQ